MLGLKSTLTNSGSSRAAALTTSSSSSSRLGSSVLLDSMDQTLLLHLTSLQANQLEDLANVLLPHLTVDPRAGGSSSAPTPPAGPLTTSEVGETTAMLLEPLDVSNTMEYGNTQPRQLKDKVRVYSVLSSCVTRSWQLASCYVRYCNYQCCGSGPAFILVGCIRIRIGNTDPGPDPGGLI
jgi:hypothetical protein